MKDHRGRAFERGAAGAPITNGRHRVARRTRATEASGKLAVVAGDAIEPAGPTRAPPTALAARGREQPAPRQRTRRGSGAPFGFVPLAVLAVLFLALPLVGLARARAVGHLTDDLRAPRRADGAAALARLLARRARRCSVLRRAARLAARARAEFPGRRRRARPRARCRWCCRRSSAASRCFLAFGRRGLVGQWLDELVRHHAARSRRRARSSPRRSWRCRSS